MMEDEVSTHTLSDPVLISHACDAQEARVRGDEAASLHHLHLVLQRLEKFPPTPFPRQLQDQVLHNYCTAFSNLLYPVQHFSLFLKYSAKFQQRLLDPESDCQYRQTQRTCLNSTKNLGVNLITLQLSRVIVLNRISDYGMVCYECGLVLDEYNEICKSATLDPFYCYRAMAFQMLGLRELCDRDVAVLRKLQWEGNQSYLRRIVYNLTRIEFRREQSDETLPDYSSEKEEEFQRRFAARLALVMKQRTREGLRVFGNPFKPASYDLNTLANSFMSSALLHSKKVISNLSELESRIINGLPVICSLRQTVDSMVHVAFSDRVKPGEMFREEKPQVAVLRFSDALKSPLLLNPKVKGGSSVFRDLMPVASSARELASDLEGLVIAYHLIHDFEWRERAINDSVVRWVIKDGEIVHFDRKMTPSGVRIGALLERLTEIHSRCAFSTHEVSETKQNQATLFENFHDLLLGGLEPFFSDVDHVTIVPDQELFRVPFTCLLSRSTGRFFVETHSCSCSASLRLISEIARLKESVLLKKSGESGGETSSQSSVLIAGLADLIPECRSLVETHSSSSRGSSSPVVVLSHSDFTPSRFRRCVNSLRPHIIHLSSHGEATTFPHHEQTDLSVFPILSEFVCAGSIQCTGTLRLYARDFALEFDMSHTDLVFLNCCSLADGQLPEVGILGFNRACFQAGCPSVVSALWPVYSEPAMIVASKFYSHLLDGMDKAQALRESILGFMADAECRDLPILWGAFQLYGNRF